MLSTHHHRTKQVTPPATTLALAPKSRTPNHSTGSNAFSPNDLHAIRQFFLIQKKNEDRGKCKASTAPTPSYPLHMSCPLPTQPHPLSENFDPLLKKLNMAQNLSTRRIPPIFFNPKMKEGSGMVNATTDPTCTHPPPPSSSLFTPPRSLFKQGISPPTKKINGNEILRSPSFFPTIVPPIDPIHRPKGSVKGDTRCTTGVQARVSDTDITGVGVHADMPLRNQNKKIDGNLITLEINRPTLLRKSYSVKNDEKEEKEEHGQQSRVDWYMQNVTVGTHFVVCHGW